MRYQRSVASVAVLAALTLTTGLAACSSGQAAGSTSDSGAVKIEVSTSGLGTVLYGLAQQVNAFGQQGIKVTEDQVDSGQESIAVQQLLVGRADFAFLTLPSVAAIDSQYVSKGQPAPLKVVAATPNVSNVVLSSKVKYTGLDSLRGLRIGIASVTSDHRINFDYYLSEHHTSTAALGIKYVPIGASDMPAALASGQIDGFIHSEPTATIATTQDHAKVAFRLGGVINQKATNVVVTPTTFLKSDPGTVRKLVDALQQTSKDFGTMPESKVVSAYASFAHAAPQLMRSVYEQKDFDPRLQPLRQAADAFWQVSFQPMVAQHLVTAKLTQNDVFDYDYS